MPNQDKFENAAKAICHRNQGTLDLKLFPSHWTGYEDVKARHKKEIQELAKKYEVVPDLKQWKLNGHWM